MVYANEEKVDWNNLILSEDYLNLLDEDPQDVRHSVMQVSAIANNTDLPEAARDKKVYLAKFPGKTGDPRDNNLCIVRLSEIYLNAAEAGLKIGGEQATKGMEYLNEVITNRTTNTAMKVNAAADFTLERILKERRKELVGEGLAVYDYTRNKLPVVRKGSWHLTSLETSNAYTIQPNDSRLAIPIPQTEIDANPNLVLNWRQQSDNIPVLWRWKSDNPGSLAGLSGLFVYARLISHPPAGRAASKPFSSLHGSHILLSFPIAGKEAASRDWKWHTACRQSAISAASGRCTTLFQAYFAVFSGKGRLVYLWQQAAGTAARKRPRGYGGAKSASRSQPTLAVAGCESGRASRPESYRQRTWVRCLPVCGCGPTCRNKTHPPFR